MKRALEEDGKEEAEVADVDADEPPSAKRARK